MLDIDAWLRGIGLGQYAELFRANDIEAELLPRLTADDLKDMGVASLGHRKKLLEAIAALGAATDMSSPPPGRRGPALRGGAAPAHRDVRGSGRLDRAVGTSWIPKTCAS